MIKAMNCAHIDAIAVLLHFGRNNAVGILRCIVPECRVRKSVRLMAWC